MQQSRKQPLLQQPPPSSRTKQSQHLAQIPTRPASITQGWCNRTKAHLPGHARILRKSTQAHKISGNIIVHVVVDTEGHVQDAQVFRSAAEDFTSKNDRDIASTFDPKAVEAVQQYRFEPGTFHGKPVPVELNVEVNFQIF
jgi:TonB family protein